MRGSVVVWLVAMLGAPVVAAAQPVAEREPANGLTAPTEGRAETEIPFVSVEPAREPVGLEHLTRVQYREPLTTVYRNDASVAFELVGGLLGTVVGATPLFADGLQAGALLTVPLAVTLGVVTGGAAAGGDGGFGSVLLGYLTGALAAIPLAFVGSDVVALSGALVLPLAGGVLGYELSNGVPLRSSVEP